MTIYGVDGCAEVTALNKLQSAYDGYQTTVMLDNNLQAASEPAPPERYDYRIVRALPLSYLR